MCQQFRPEISPSLLNRPALLERLDEEQQGSFRSLWYRLPPHIREFTFDLHGDGWAPVAINRLADVLHNFRGAFSTSLTDPGACSLLPFKRDLSNGTAPVRSKPYSMDLLVAEQVSLSRTKSGLIQHLTSINSSPIVVVVIPKQLGALCITVHYQELNRVSHFSQLPCLVRTKM